MDKKINKNEFKNHLKWIVPSALVLVAVLWFINRNSVPMGGQQQKLSLRSLMVSTVVKGQFDDYLNVQGTVVPKITIFLDAVAGGRVEERFVQQGDHVEQGQPLVRLSNTTLQLDVISREAQISEQLNFLRNTQMQAESNRLDLRRALLDTENQIAHLERKIKQSKRLLNTGAVTTDELAEFEQDLNYKKKIRELNIERQTQEEKVRYLQIKQLEESAEMLQKNLQFARDNIKNLTVKAPLSGYLSDFSVELGESKEQGARLGQIDIPGKFKVVASLDEYYLNRVSLGMTVNVEIQGEKRELTISKIDGRVNNAQFKIEVDLPDETNADTAQSGSLVSFKRGQTLAMDIVLSKSNKETLIVERGAFLNSTGGNWIFVLSPDNQFAQRRAISMGKKNQQFVEILKGLNEGDKVIISGYSAFDKADTLTF